MTVSKPARDVGSWLADFAAALAGQDAGAVAALFEPGGLWRDLLAFSWTIATFEGRPAIEALVEKSAAPATARDWSTEAAEGASEGWIAFTTASGNGRGYVRLRGGLCHTLLTTLEQLGDHEEPTGTRRPSGVYADGDAANWLDRRKAETERLGITEQPYVLVIGGGQGGLSLGARLKLLGVPCLIVDRHPRIGDQWRSRYKSLTLHDPVWYDHMPCLPFPDHWPVFTPKDKMGDWLEAYAEIMELNVWTSAECRGAHYDAAAARWNVSIHRDGEDFNLRPVHLVMATGNAGFPHCPEIPGHQEFQGVQCHSSAHPGGEGMAGKRVVVVGANNSAHDICADLVEHGAEVTMIQRSSTLVVRQSTFCDVLLKPLYSEEAVAAGLTTERADLLAASMPIRVQEEFYKPVWEGVRAYDAAFYQQLEAAGFKLDFAEDGTGLAMKYLRAASGYYIDVGASAMIADGRIKLRSGQEIERITADGLVLADGTHLEADAIVYATGFGSMEEWVARLIGPDVAARVGKCWGYGSGFKGDPGPWVGELRNMWAPTAQPGLWFHGGNLQQARFFSRYLALQLKARFEGLPVDVVKP